MKTGGAMAWEYESNMISETERKEFLEALERLKSAMALMDYLTPDSYRDAFRDRAAKDLFVTLSRKMFNVRDTYCQD
jgi:hypothetical protein